MVGHEDARCAGWHAVQALGDDAYAADAKGGSGDEACRVVKRVHVAGDERPGDEENGRGNGEKDDGSQNEQGVEHVYGSLFEDCAGV